MYLVLAAAGIAAAAASIGIGDLICRDRHGIDTADQLSSLRFLIGGNESVLRRLGSLELERLVFGKSRLILVIQAVVLHLRQLAHDGIDTVVLAVDDVPSGRLHQVPGSAVLSGDGVLQILCGGSLLAATLGKLSLERVGILHPSHGVCLDGVLDAKTGVQDIGVDTVHLGKLVITQIANPLLETIDAALEVIQGESLIDVSTGRPALARGRAQAVSGVTTPAAAIATPAKHAEDQKQDDPGGPIASPAAETAVSALIGGSNRHRHHSAVRRKTHCVISFVDLFSKPGRDFD